MEIKKVSEAKYLYDIYIGIVIRHKVCEYRCSYEFQQGDLEL